MKSIFLLLLFVVCLQVNAQQQGAPKNPSIKEVFAFIDTYHPKTPLYGGIGGAVFPVTSTNPNVVPYFNMGIDMLHAFWPSEAIRAFRQVLALDPSCAMAYWGLYHAFTWDYGYILAREEAIASAEHYSFNITDREQLYIRSILPGNDWNATYQVIMQRYPWDVHAKSFWAWAVVDSTVNYMDAPHPGRVAVQNFLNEQAKLHPYDTGIEHYIIHAWEDTRTPDEALDATEEVATLAPNAGHIVHMPGHIYHLLGDHDTAHDCFYNGMLVDQWAMGNFSVTFQEYWEYIHNIAYMTGNLGEGGRHAEAVKWATVLQALDVNPNQPLLLDWDPAYNRPAARYYFQGLLALPLLHFQYSAWEEAQSSLTLMIKFLQPAIGGTSTEWLLNYYDALRQYACVLGALQKSDSASASTCYSTLTSLYTSLSSFMVRPGFGVGNRAYRALGVCVAEAEGVVLAINRNWDAAINQLLRANASEATIPYNEPPIYTRPVLETVAEVLLQRANVTGNTSYIQQAAVTYSQILESPWHNNSGFGWYGIGYSYSLAGNVPAATYAFREFLKVWSTADNNLPQVVYAKLYLNVTATESYFSLPTRSYSTLITLSGIFLVLFILNSASRFRRNRR